MHKYLDHRIKYGDLLVLWSIIHIFNFDTQTTIHDTSAQHSAKWNCSTISFRSVVKHLSTHWCCVKRSIFDFWWSKNFSGYFHLFKIEPHFNQMKLTQCKPLTAFQMPHNAYLSPCSIYHHWICATHCRVRIYFNAP